MQSAGGKVIDDVAQPESFEFSAANMKEAESIMGCYPPAKVQSAVMPLLSIAQKQSGNWLPKAAMDYIAHMLNMPPIRVYEVATFYSMYNLRPMGKYHVQLCTTTPCWLRGSDEVVKACKDHLGIGFGDTTADGMFTLEEVECLGACVNAPMCQVTSAATDEYYEDLTAENVVEVLKGFASGKPLKVGPQNQRHASEPIGMKVVPMNAPTKPAPKKAAAKKAPAKKTTAKKKGS